MHTRPPVYVVRKSEEDGRILSTIAGPMQVSDATALVADLNASAFEQSDAKTFIGLAAAHQIIESTELRLAVA